MESPKKYLYIPVEIKVRELPAKMLLAAEAAKRGFTVVIGRKAEIMEIMAHVPPGIFLGSWAGENFAAAYTDLKAQGHVVAVMDEEGLVTFSDDMYVRFKLSDKTLEQIDLFFTWGEKQLSVLQKHCKPQSMPELVCSGNVRVDILRPEYRTMAQKQIDALRERFGRFILLNSSFGRGNHFKGSEQYAREQWDKKIIQNEEDFAFFERCRTLQEKIIADYLKALPKIAQAFPDHRIIIRPHPSENFDTWRRATKGYDNIHVINEGAVHNWLLACDVLVHNFCTTALEAYIADIPSIAFRPHMDPGMETELPYMVSLQAHTQEELIDSLHHVIVQDGKRLSGLRRENEETVLHYISNAKDVFAHSTMINAFERFAPEEKTELSRSYFLWRRFKDMLRQIKRRIFSGSGYVDHKFSTLDQNELKDILSSIDPEAENLSVDQLSRFCFAIHR